MDLGVLADPPLSLDVVPVVLAHEVVESGARLFARDPDVEAEFVTRTRARWWDFKPYREAQWRLAGERLAERSPGSSIPRSGRS